MMLEEAFKKYVSNYDLDNEDIKLKYNHSFRVMELQDKYAKLLGFNEDEIELAKIIGLLHDIGRFEQLKVYKTYDDSKSVDHADYSCTQLFDKGEISKFCEKKEWYKIIEFAIRYHNKFVLEQVDDEEMMKQAKLIRDTDKIDIIYLLGYLKELYKDPVDDVINDEVMNNIRNYQNVDKKFVHNRNDHRAIQYSFAFDINNDVCLEELKRNYGYLLELDKDNKQIEEIYNIIIKYIDERLEKWKN